LIFQYSRLLAYASSYSNPYTWEVQGCFTWEMGSNQRLMHPDSCHTGRNGLNLRSYPPKAIARTSRIESLTSLLPYMRQSFYIPVVLLSLHIEAILQLHVNRSDAFSMLWPCRIFHRLPSGERSDFPTAFCAWFCASMHARSPGYEERSCITVPSFGSTLEPTRLA
jgi:hypothetical protein